MFYLKTFFKIVAFVSVLAILLMVLGFDLPFLGKPENAVKKIMTQESLMDILSSFEEDFSKIKEDDENYSMISVELIRSPGIKSFFLDNVRTMSYNITNVSKNGDEATVTALITHLDIYPVVECAYDLLESKILEYDSIPENDEELKMFLLPLVQKSINEAVSKTKPTSTYTNVIFECKKDSVWPWELKELPDDFVEVLLMNIDPAVEKAAGGHFN